MLTDEKKAMMLASFDVFRRPTPKMYRIQKSHDLAVHYWGLGVPLTHNSLKELWFKLYRERRARASEILCPWDNRSPPNGCIQ